MSEERERLLTREMIDAIDDLESLQFLLDDADERAKHIEVDLEFRSDADLDWERRARGALAAHHICIGHLGRRIRALSPKRERPEGSAAAKIEAKARKHAAVAERAVQENETRRVKAERERVAALKNATDFARKSSFLLAFHQAAAEQLEGGMMGRLSSIAGQRVVAWFDEAFAPAHPAEMGLSDLAAKPTTAAPATDDLNPPLSRDRG